MVCSWVCLLENIDQILPNKLHGPKHYKIGVTYVYNAEWTCVLYSVVITRQSNPPISLINSPCNEFMSIWSMFWIQYFSWFLRDTSDWINFSLALENCHFIALRVKQKSWYTVTTEINNCTTLWCLENILSCSLLRMFIVNDRYQWVTSSLLISLFQKQLPLIMYTYYM